MCHMYVLELVTNHQEVTNKLKHILFLIYIEQNIGISISKDKNICFNQPINIFNGQAI